MDFKYYIESAKHRIYIGRFDDGEDTVPLDRCAGFETCPQCVNFTLRFPLLHEPESSSQVHHQEVNNETYASTKYM